MPKTNNQPFCPYCGAVDGVQYEIEDRDESVGYNSLEIVCTICRPKE